MSEIAKRPRRWPWIVGIVAAFLSGLALGVILLAAGTVLQFNVPCPVSFRPMPGDQLATAQGPGFVPPHTTFHPLRFPAAGKMAHLQGIVAMLVYVEADGRVAQTHVLRSSGFCPFDAEAQRAVPQWRFTPATSFGKPVATWWTINVEFILRDRNGTPLGGPMLQLLPPGRPRPRPVTIRRAAALFMPLE